MSLGGTDVITQCHPRDLCSLNTCTIRRALENKTHDDEHLIESIMFHAHKTVLELIQAFLGDKVGLRGTMGAPVIVSDAIRKVEEEVGKALLRTYIESLENLHATVQR